LIVRRLLAIIISSIWPEGAGNIDSHHDVDIQGVTE
jgi:hypothetical protein